MPRGAILPGILLVFLALWLLDPDTVSDAVRPTKIDSVETVSPRSLSAVDGDTIKRAGQTIRLVGFDTPETYQPQCDAELRRGKAATAKLRELLASASTAELTYLPRRDQYGRELARLTLDGRDVADILVREGLARHYHGGQRQSWC